MLRLAVSHLQSFQRYRAIEEVTLEECLAQLRREEPVTPAMQASKVLHRALEHASYDTETSCLQWKGYTFFFQCDIDLVIPDVRELKGEKEFATPSGPVLLVGIVDSIHGAICDYKLSARFDAERLAESFQWRCYLSMFDRSEFVYKVFVGEEIKPQEWAIRDYHEFSVYRYPDMEADVQRSVEEFAAFVVKYLPRAA